jgi:hypothetical protein
MQFVPIYFKKHFSEKYFREGIWKLKLTKNELDSKARQAQPK